MDKLFIIVFHMTFTASFVLTAVTIAKRSIDKFLSSFVSGEKSNVKQDEELKYMIEDYKEG